MPPEPLIHHHVIDRLAIIAGFGSGLALYPQVYLILTNGSPDGVSILTFGVILINSFVWLLYSVHRLLLSLGIASVLNIIASSTVIIWYLGLPPGI